MELLFCNLELTLNLMLVLNNNVKPIIMIRICNVIKRDSSSFLLM